MAVASYLNQPSMRTQATASSTMQPRDTATTNNLLGSVLGGLQVDPNSAQARQVTNMAQTVQNAPAPSTWRPTSYPATTSPTQNQTRPASNAPVNPPGTTTTNLGGQTWDQYLAGRSPTTSNPSTPTQTPTTTTPYNIGGWNPTLPQMLPAQGGEQASYTRPAQTFFAGDPNIWNSAAYRDNDAQTPNYISSVLPVAQFDQNNYQYATDFNEAQRRWNAEFGVTQGQNQYQQSLSTRQQQAAEWQAQQAANQWNQQFGWTQQTDQWGRDISNRQLDLQGQQIGNQYNVDMDQNRATRDVANTYANSNMYQANQQLAGQQYMSDQDRIAAMYGADAGVRQAGMYSDAQRYQAQLGLQEAQGYAGAQRYQADQGLLGQQYQAQLGLQEAQGYAGAQRYGAELGLQGQQYQANAGVQQAGIYGNAQRYQADRGYDEAGLYSNAQRYGYDTQFAGQRYETDAQERMNQLMMANNLAVANTQAYGRSQAPNTNWARSWG